MPERPDESAAEALARARKHAARAAGEAIAALRALADAASLGWTGRPSEAHAALRDITRMLDAQSQRFLEGEGVVPVSVMQAILDALDQEIARWEERAAQDPEARAVLRTFLGLREILWEFGFRRGDESSPASAAQRGRTTRPRSAGRGARTQTPKKRARVQRVDVQG